MHRETNVGGGSCEIEFLPVQFGKLYSSAQSLLLRCNSLRKRRGSFAKTSFADPIGFPPFVASLQKEFFIRRRAASPPIPWTARLVTNARRFTKGVSLSIPPCVVVALPHPIYLPSDPPLPPLMASISDFPFAGKGEYFKLDGETSRFTTFPEKLDKNRLR